MEKPKAASQNKVHGAIILRKIECPTCSMSHSHCKSQNALENVNFFNSEFFKCFYHEIQFH